MMNQTEAQKRRQAERDAQRAALRTEIRNRENAIDGLEEEIRRMSQIVERQRAAKGRYENMCSQIECAKERKKGSVREIETYGRNVKFLDGYQSRMYDFLSGQRAAGSREYVEDALIRMQNEINTNEQKIEELRAGIRQHNRSIEELLGRMGRI